jgi:hypothetical protein
MKDENPVCRMTTLGERSPPIGTASSGATVTPLSDFFVLGGVPDMVVLNWGQREMLFSRAARAVVTTFAPFSSVQAKATLLVPVSAQPPV